MEFEFQIEIVLHKSLIEFTIIEIFDCFAEDLQFFRWSSVLKFSPLILSKNSSNVEPTKQNFLHKSEISGKCVKK